MGEATKLKAEEVRDAWKVDLDRLHSYLWDIKNRVNTVKIHQGELGKEIGVDRFHLSRLITKMVEQGRMKQVASSQGNIKTYLIYDPYAKDYEL